MIDLRALGDDEIIDLIGLARGEDRRLLVSSLAWTRGHSGVSFLRAALSQGGPGSASLRCAAMAALTRRLGKEAVPDLVPLLTDNVLDVQLTAAMLIEDVDDGRNVDAVLLWLGRRLRAKRRVNTWGLYEVSGLLRYAIRVGVLPQVLRKLEQERDRLQREEVELLNRAWAPSKRALFLESGEPADGPDASAVEDWYQESVGVWKEEELLAFDTEWVGPVLKKLRRRRDAASRETD